RRLRVRRRLRLCARGPWPSAPRRLGAQSRSFPCGGRGRAALILAQLARPRRTKLRQFPRRRHRRPRLQHAAVTNRTPYPRYYGAGSRLAANRGEWRPLGAAPSGSYADDREWGGGRDDGRSWLERAGEAVSGWFGGDDDDHREERGYRGHGP